MIGKVNLSLNGVDLKNLNVQAFIVTGDGRTYTAITGVPPEIGYSMQLLVSIGSFVGFLFAKPIGDAPNGYQLTGHYYFCLMFIFINKTNSNALFFIRWCCQSYSRHIIWFQSPCQYTSKVMIK